MTENQRIRDDVSAAYARAVALLAAGSCRGLTQKGVAARSAGYRNDELEGLPDEAVANSFGCGNPLAFSDVGEGDTVLDLGCGAGIDLLLAAQRVGRAGRVIGIDMTDAMLAKARETIAESGLPNVEIRKGLIEDLPVSDASIDWVISNCVINLSPDKKTVFAEIARILKPGGNMLVSDIVAENISQSTGRLLVACGSCIAGAISEEEYEVGLREAGLIDVEVRERIRYDVEQLTSLIGSDIGALGKTYADGIACDYSSDRLVELVETCVGKVWSAKVFASRPE